MWNTLHGCRPGTDNCDAFIAQVVHRSARGITAGVFVVPATGVERMSLKGFDAGNTRKLGYVKRSRGHTNILRAKLVTPVGFNKPMMFCFIPSQVGDLRMKQCFVIQVELFPYALAVFK